MVSALTALTLVLVASLEICNGRRVAPLPRVGSSLRARPVPVSHSRATSGVSTAADSQQVAHVPLATPAHAGNRKWTEVQLMETLGKREPAQAALIGGRLVQASPERSRTAMRAWPTPKEALENIDTAIYTVDRQRDELFSAVKRSVVGDRLAALAPSKYVLRPTNATVAVTGATAGIGREAALFLAQAGFGVIICARDVQKAEEAVKYIRERERDANISVVPLDLASVRSVQEAAPLIVAAAAGIGKPLRGLLLNAGVWPGDFRTTQDGMELAVQANHIGHWQLTQLLLPELQVGLASGEEARVVTVSSSAHAFVSDTGLDDIDWEQRPFESTANYARAKLANLLFAQELARRTPPSVRSIAVHPGIVLTSLFKELGPGSASGSSDDQLAGVPLQQLLDLQAATPLKLVFKSPEEGSRPLLYGLLAPELRDGAYVVDCEDRDVSPASKSTEAPERLWEWTRAWVERALQADDAADESTATASSDIELTPPVVPE